MTAARRKPPVIVVQRKVGRSGDRYWYHANFQAIEMSEALALQGARRGELKIKTINDRK